MLKTISAALLAVAVIAAPALAADSGKSAQTPAKTTQAAPANIAKTNTVKAKPSVLNANAKMGRHHGRHHARHHGSHHKMGALKTHKISKVGFKQAAPTAKRG